MPRKSSDYIRAGIQIAAVLVLLAGLLGASSHSAVASVPIPTFSIVSVIKDTSVTIKTANFPANKTFTVRMGMIGTKAIGGIEVGSFDSSKGGVLQITFNIPAELKGQSRIAIRTDASSGGYYSYNWFWNNPSAGTATPYTGIPTFSIVGVIKDSKVAIKTSNFPAGKTFTVRMGKIGTKAIGGVEVGKFESGKGGVMTVAFDIPQALKGQTRIAIRADANSGGYYSYNWFWNTEGGTSTTPYYGIPTFSITTVVKDTTVSVKTSNFPSGKIFTVRIGTYGTKGVGGIIVGTLDSDGGGVLTAEFTIPESLKGADRLAIRMDADGGFNAYNWFWNNPEAAPKPYTGIPTFSIVGVIKDSKVAIKTNNYPANREFTVRMGLIGTRGIGGIVVGKFNSGAGGVMTVTFDIPKELKGQSQIAIRADASGGFYSYGWFYNNTYP